MSLTVATKNTMLSALTLDSISAHTAFPGSTGANEVVGGTYARQAVTFAAASGGSRTMSAAASFPIPAGTTVKWLGLWNGATYLGYSPNGGSPKEFFASPVTSVITCPGHGYVNGSTVTIYGDTMPGGLTEGVTYFIVTATADTFQVSATVSGTPITIASAGGSALTVSAITEENYAAAGTHIIASWAVGLPD